MGLLSGEFTEQDLAFDETKLTDPKKFKRGTLADIGLGTVSGVAKGVTSVSNAASRFVEGDEVADRRMQQANEAFTPLNQGTAGHIASGITEVIAAGTVGAPLGPYGMATTVGLGTRATEHTKLTQQLGVDQETADTASNIYGATNAALAFLPVSNVFKKSLVADYAALVVAPTAVGQASIYAEGAYLDGKGYEKQAEQYKDMATDPTAILMNLGIGTIFFAAGRYMNAKGNADLPEAEVHKAEADLNATVEQAQADADIASMPNVAETVDDLAQHQTNINQAIEQVMKGEKVNIAEATGGQLKTLDDVKKYLQTNHNVVSSNKQNNSSNNTVNKIDIKAPVAPKKDQLVKDTYQLAQAAGFSPAQARALIGELGRENDFNISTMFGFHKDEANHKQNGGIFSWQGDRAKALQAHMTAKGLVNADGTFKRTNESLQAQFEFLRKEIEANPKWKQYFLDKKNISNNEARAALGGTGSVIGWARGQSKLKSGKAFDWQSHEARANNYSNMVDGQPTSHVFESATESNVEQAPIKPESSYEGTVDRLDLDNLPDVDDLFISPHDFNAFEQRNMEHEVMGDLTTEQLDLPNMVLDKHGNLVPDPNYKPMSDVELSKLIDDVFAESETVSVPYTSNTIKVKDRVDDPAKEFKPDESIATDWKEKQRYEDKKYHKELTRTYKDKDGNTVQELQYRGSYVRRTVDDAHQTKSIHVGRSNKSNFVDHKGNKELETALDRIFDESRAFGYLSQIPKGQQTIDKLIANPDLVISSKKTGEDLTAAQWKDKLIREQDNIQMMAKAMSTLAKCALKQAA
ncbi:phage tail tip lysozyme [Acinetobacter baumannii]|uniref:phage tail tip lysozyme n=1 Tax=Acinetobacter baumannii TaxID=470 RepID=UPI00237F7DBE|nr:phage tail tip lysozyme [Acinetobacter baumannii]MDE3319609.1 phage tail tip lysozyme [Acinetobacter baumannii]MDX5549712.1 phage tail tip lysozyme [Acinetobacter baumannii]